MIETMPTFAWTALADGYVDFVNGHWEEYTGLSTERTIGSGWEAAVHPEDLSDIPMAGAPLSQAVNPLRARCAFGGRWMGNIVGL